MYCFHVSTVGVASMCIVFMYQLLGWHFVCGFHVYCFHVSTVGVAFCMSLPCVIFHVSTVGMGSNCRVFIPSCCLIFYVFYE